MNACEACELVIRAEVFRITRTVLVGRRRAAEYTVRVCKRCLLLCLNGSVDQMTDKQADVWFFLRLADATELHAREVHLDKAKIDRQLEELLKARVVQ